MYTTGYILVLVWFVILGISLFVTGRVLYLPFVKLWNFIRDEEEIKYDAHFNPYKFRLHVVYIVMLFYPFWFYNYFIRLTKLWDAVAFLVCGSLYVSLITWVVLKKIKEPTKKWNIENSVKKNKLTAELIELKPSSFTANEIKEKFDFAIENDYFVCELSQFEDFLNLREPETKIIWLPISESNTTKKDKQMLIDFLHPLFSKGLHKVLPRKKVSFFINKYFEFNQINHPIENPFKDDIIGDWLKNPKYKDNI